MSKDFSKVSNFKLPLHLVLFAMRITANFYGLVLLALISTTLARTRRQVEDGDNSQSTTVAPTVALTPECTNYCDALAASQASASTTEAAPTGEPVAMARSADSTDGDVNNIPENQTDETTTVMSVEEATQALTDAGQEVNSCVCPANSSATGEADAQNSENDKDLGEGKSSSHSHQKIYFEKYGAFLTIALVPYFLH